MDQQQLPPASPGSWYDYVQGHLDRLEWSGPRFEAETGIARTRLGEWRKGKSVSIDVAKRMAEAFSRPVLEVLVAAGLLTPEEAEQRPGAMTPEDLSDDQLLGEVRRRMRGGRGAPELTAEEVAANPDRYTPVGRRKRTDTGPVRRVEAT